ncbi:MAG: hypothetical protein ACFFCS_29785 [Candidatus Hodarchaeota archaeon]
MEKQRKLQLVLIFSILSTALFIFVQPTSAILEEKATVQPGDYWHKETSISTNDSKELVIKSTANFSIWFLNVSEYADFLVDDTINISAIPADFNTFADGEIDTTEAVQGVYVIREGLTSEAFNASPYNLPLEVTNPAEPTKLGVYLYVVVQNHDLADEQVIMIMFDPKPYFLDNIRVFFKIGGMALQLILVIWLFFSIKEAKRDKEEHRIKSYTAWGFGFTLALISKVIMEAAHYYDRDVGLYLYPQNRLQGALVSVIFPSAVNTAVPTAIFLMTFGGAFIGYIFVIERLIKKKKPILTVNLAIAAGLMPLVWVLPEDPVLGPLTYADIFTMYLLASVIIGVVMVFLTYINVAVKTTGALRKKALFTMLGVILPMLFQILEHFDLLPKTIPDVSVWKTVLAQSLVMLGFIFFYKAMKKDRI